MKYFALTYDVVEGFAERRMPYRGDHLKLVREAHSRGDLLMAGALGDPPNAALLVFRAADAALVEGFARHDPYVLNGVVTAWRVRPWTVVVGGEPAS
jgi:uncharacterized protein YciI